MRILLMEISELFWSMMVYLVIVFAFFLILKTVIDYVLSGAKKHQKDRYYYGY